MEYQAEYNALFKSEQDPTTCTYTGTTSSQTTAGLALLNRSMKGFVCPSNPNVKFKIPTQTPPQGAFTNYKAMGGTCPLALKFVLTPPPTSAPYGSNTYLFPDGALYPGTGTRFADIADGTSKTIAVAETMDDKASRWTVGREVTMFGLPASVVTSSNVAVATGYGSFYAPGGGKDYDGTFGPTSGVGVKETTYGPYIGYDFTPSGANYASGGPTTYATDDAATGYNNSPAPNYGPSSNHPGVVNHLFIDGSVQAIRKDLDGAGYFFLITRNGGDPFPLQ